MGNKTKQNPKLEKENKDAKKKIKKKKDKIRVATDLDKTVKKMGQPQKACPSER